MSFDTDYKKIISSVDDDVNSLNKSIEELFAGKEPLNKELLNFLTAPAKRIRPILGFLFLRGVFGEINQSQMDVLIAVELVHNATLIHDDVIDNAEKRRDKETLNSKFNTDLAVIAGDFLLSVAFEKIINVANLKVIELFVNALKQTCKGEINQYFTKFNLPTIDCYIEKSRQKTALLFEIGILSGIYLSDKNFNDLTFECAKKFSENFGIGFQIRDDLLNVEKVVSDDIKAGVYTAPVIFAAAENNEILKTNNVQMEIQKTTAIEKTKSLIDNYFTQAEQALSVLEETKYKKSLIDLINLIKRDI